MCVRDSREILRFWALIVTKSPTEFGENEIALQNRVNSGTPKWKL